MRCSIEESVVFIVIITIIILLYCSVFTVQCFSGAPAVYPSAAPCSTSSFSHPEKPLLDEPGFFAKLSAIPAAAQCVSDDAAAQLIGDAFDD